MNTQNNKIANRVNCFFKIKLFSGCVCTAFLIRLLNLDFCNFFFVLEKLNWAPKGMFFLSQLKTSTQLNCDVYFDCINIPRVLQQKRNFKGSTLVKYKLLVFFHAKL